MTPDEMWVAALLGPSTFVSTSVRRPTAADLTAGQVLLEVHAGGICGSDGPFVRGAPSRFETGPEPGFWGPPGFPMHEVAGTVLASTHPEHAPGDRVVGWADRFDGAAELTVTNGDSLSGYDDGLTATEAVLLQPLACVLHAVSRLGDVRGRCCAVLGTGPIGALFVHVLADAGASTVSAVDRVNRRADAALRSADAVHVVDSQSWAAGLSEEQRPEILVEAVGHQVATLQHALEAVASSGTVLYFGVPDSDIYPIDMELMMRKHLTLLAGGTLHRRDALRRANEYVLLHPELPAALLTHVFGRQEIQEAYDNALRPASGRYKVVVEMRG